MFRSVCQRRCVGATFQRSRVVGQNHPALFLEEGLGRRRGLKPPPRGFCLQRDVAEEVGHRLAVVGSSDGLRQDHGDVDDLEANRKSVSCSHSAFQSEFTGHAKTPPTHEHHLPLDRLSHSSTSFTTPTSHRYYSYRTLH